ncbi:MAG: DNA alkylation repair protein [Candidatus Bathyarchaeota archaeon]|nr:MAG: DNA alkylation repair protein [Candidatus Bathyarchaeota archaeon]
MLWVKTSQVRKLIGRYANHFQQLSLAEKFRLATMFYKSRIFEQATIGDALLELCNENMTPNAFNLLDKTMDYVHNWASVDSLCLHVMQPPLLKYRDETLELLWKHNFEVTFCVAPFRVVGRTHMHIRRVSLRIRRT